jgi:hypothetical protein
LALTETEKVAAGRMGCGKMALYGLAGLFALGVIGQFARDPVPSGEPAASPPPGLAPTGPPELAVTARELRAAYAANEIAAKQRFAGKRLRVTGTIEALDLDFSDNPVIRLTTDDMFQSVQAQFDKADAAAIAALNKGARATVICSRVTEALGAPLLSDCTLASD